MQINVSVERWSRYSRGQYGRIHGTSSSRACEVYRKGSDVEGICLMPPLREVYAVLDFWGFMLVAMGFRRHTWRLSIGRLILGALR